MVNRYLACNLILQHKLCYDCNLQSLVPYFESNWLAEQEAFDLNHFLLVTLLVDLVKVEEAAKDPYQGRNWDC